MYSVINLYEDGLVVSFVIFVCILFKSKTVVFRILVVIYSRFCATFVIIAPGFNKSFSTKSYRNCDSVEVEIGICV